MACNHVGGPELIAMAEEHLRNSNIPESQWSTRRFRFSENLTDGMWASVITEVERRGDDWVVVRLDRNSVAVEETGFVAL
jgi:hypothetical protein